MSANPVRAKAKEETMSPDVDKRALEQHLIEKAALVEALKKYAQCRHACENCNCTLEARAALYPYIVREKMLGQP